jgi:SAM-dependent methyltransferase
LETLFGPGDCVLELGCGTGEDAVWLAGRGARVVATDVAPAMLAIARRKAAAAGVDASIRFRRLDINHVQTWTPGMTFDGLLSNFGVLNCISDWRPLAKAAARLLRPGARAALVVMSPVCPWEIAWHLLHGDVRTALRRFRSGEEAHVGCGETVPVWYPSSRLLRSQFAPFFQHVKTVGIGALLPPMYLCHLVDRRPALFQRLGILERRWRGHFPWTRLNDHYLIVFERSESVT